MKFNIKSKERITFLIIFLIIAFIQFGIQGFRNYTLDDTYMYFIYAKNVVDGNDFSYNANQFSSATTPLWTSIFIVYIKFFGTDNILLAAKIINLVLTLLVSLVSYLIVLKIINREAALFTALLIATAPFIILFSTCGADTIIFTLFTLLAIYEYILKKNLFASAFSALSFLSRPEGAFLFLLIIIHATLKEISSKTKLSKIIKNRIIEIIIFSIIVSPWLIFLLYNQGTIFSTSFLGKNAMYESVAYSIGPFKFSYSPLTDLLTMSPLLLLIASIAFLYEIKKRKILDEKFLLYFWWILLLAIHMFIALSIHTYRYLTPAIPFIAITSMVFLSSIRRKNLVKYFFIVLIILNIVELYFLSLKAVEVNNFYSSFFELGGWINQNIPSNDKIALGELGIIKWVTGRYIFDISGIVNLDASKYTTAEGFFYYLKSNDVKYFFVPDEYITQGYPLYNESRFSKLKLSKMEFSGIIWGIYEIP